MAGVERPKLVASDVDGTLLNPMDEVTERTAAAVRRTVAAGTPFVLVSGRPPRWIPPVAEAIGIDGFAVCANGAVVYDIATDRIVATHLLAPEVLVDLALAVATVLPDAKIATERVGAGALSLAGRESLAEYGYEHLWAEHIPQAAKAELVGQPAVKLLVRQPGATSAELTDAVRAAVGDVVDITYSTNDGLIELSPPGITKATGLADVADRLSVTADEVVAFGDMPNDVAMLRWAGHGVAMANAHPAAKTVADEITAANTADGVAQVLERWF